MDFRPFQFIFTGVVQLKKEEKILKRKTKQNVYIRIHINATYSGDIKCNVKLKT